MYRKGSGPSNLSGLDENPDYTCPDEPELPVVYYDWASHALSAGIECWHCSCPVEMMLMC